MEIPQDTKQFISQASTICIIPKEEPESVASALALFYTLKELRKNVNLVIENFPETCSFLIPSLDFISSPKNFVISIPKQVADISQVYYEKNEENLKIHLTLQKGNLKKDDISFYFTNAKPDVIITLGIQDFQQELEGRLDSFGFLLDTPILNIDNNSDNKKFGLINMMEEKSLSQMALEIIKNTDGQINKNNATCILAGLTLHYQNFQDPATSPEMFELCAQLMKQGANRQEIIQALYPQKTPDVGLVKDKAFSLS